MHVQMVLKLRPVNVVLQRQFRGHRACVHACVYMCMQAHGVLQFPEIFQELEFFLKGTYLHL